MAGAGGPVVVGAVAVDIVPSAKNFLSKLIKEVGPQVAAVAESAGEAIEKRVAEKTADGLKDGFKEGKKTAAKEGAKAGSDFSGGFAAAVKAGLKAAQSAIGDFTVEAKLDNVAQVRAGLASVKAMIKEVGDVQIGVNVDEGEFLAKVALIKAELNRLTRQNTDLGLGSELRNAGRALDGLVEKIQAANTQSGAFAQKIDSVLKGLLSTLTDTDVEFDLKVLGGDSVEAQIDRLRQKIMQIRSDSAKGLLDGNAVKQQIGEVSAELARLQGLKLDDRFSYEIREASKAAEGLVNDLDGVKDRTVNVKVEADTSKLAGFGASIKRIAQQAADKITIRADLDDDEIYPELAKIKAALSDIVARVGIDYDDNEAFARIQLLLQRLKELSGRHTVNVGVSRDTDAARDILDKLVGGTRAAASGFNSASESAGGFLSQLGRMSPLAAALNLAFVGLFAALPAIIAVVAAGLAGLIGLLTVISGLAVTAGLGFGVLLLALTPIIAAIQAQESATKKAAKATLEAAQAEQTALSNKLALASADEAIASAETSLARARASATRSVTQAARTLTGAQRNLTIANEKEKDARKKLSSAYKDAKADLKKLNEEIRKNRIEQQAANVSMLQAREALNAAYADPASSGTDILAAQSAYNSAEQKVRDLKAEQAKNEAEKAKYDTVGLDANAGVISAQAALKTALESVKDAQASVTTAAENSAQAQIDAVNSVNDAELALAQARTGRNNTLKQQQLAATVAGAQKTVTEADENDPLTKLTEKGLEFVKFYEKNIEPILTKFFQTAQDSGILSGIEGFMDAIRPSLGPINELITAVGHSMGVFFIQIGNFLGSKEGTDFIDFLTENAPKGFEILASLAKTGLGFIFKLFERMGPVMDKLAPVLAEVLADIADILIEFLESDDFKELIQVMIDNLPLILYTVVDLLIAFAKMIPVLAPIGEIILFIIDSMLQFFNSRSTNQLIVLFTALGVVIALAFGWVGVLIAAVIAIVLAVTYVYMHWDEIWGWITDTVSDFIDWFVDGWTGCFEDAWSTIQGWGRWIADFWDNWIVGPIEDFISWFTEGWTACFNDALEFIRGIGDQISEFWTGLVDGIGDIWDGLRELLRDPINGVIHLVNDYLISGFNSVSGIVNGPQLDKIKDLPAVSAATGAIVPGYQSAKRDEVPAMLRKGEGVLVPEVVRAIGPQTILEWNRKANLGQKIRAFAYGGLVDQIVAFQRKSNVPFNVTSGVRGSNDYHGRGMAVDTASTAANMVSLASWLYGYSPYLLELIHSGGAGYFVKNGDKVGANYYRSVVDQHYNHVHTAMSEAGLTAVNNGIKPAELEAGKTSEEPTGLAATLISRLKAKVREGIDAAIGAISETSLGKMAVGMTDTLVGKMGLLIIEKAKELGRSVLDFGGSIVSGTTDFIKSLLGDDDESKASGKLTRDQGVKAAPQTASKYAKQMLPQFGWDSTDMESLAKLWNGESGWRWNATGSMTGLGRAYGIPQSLPGNKMASVGADWATNAFTQVLWGMGYIKDRYGDPTNAYLTWLGRNPHWYDTGGYLPPGLTVAYNGTGRHERVMTYEQEQAMMRERAALMQGRADVNVYVHDGKVTGLVTAEVDKQFGVLADEFVYGGV